MALVELRNVSKIYHLGGEEIRALDDVSLDIELPMIYSGVSGRERRERARHALKLVDMENRA